MSNIRLFMIWLSRVVANAFAGGLAFAIVGAFCGGAMGLLLGLIIGVGGAGAMIGAATGVVGILIYAIATMGEPPGDLFEPFFEITARIAFGQVWGTIAACSAFLAFELVRSMLNGIGFSQFFNNVGDDIPLMMLIAPLLMIGGATISVIFKRD